MTYNFDDFLKFNDYETSDGLIVKCETCWSQTTPEGIDHREIHMSPDKHRDAIVAFMNGDCEGSPTGRHGFATEPHIAR